LILKTVKEFEHLFCPLDPVIVDMRPEHGITLLKNVRKEKFYEVVDFMPQDLFDNLRAMAHPYTPESFSIKEYDQQVYQAYLDGHDFYQQEWSLQAKKRKRTKAKTEKKQKRIDARNNAKKNNQSAMVYTVNP
ncbi:MAG: hypothetical protein P4L31_01770, partial [Candidatus Babeliales bacterium]|nr:hypothetical protein [Candidatus Babeliales bacterium]